MSTKNRLTGRSASTARQTQRRRRRPHTAERGIHKQTEDLAYVGNLASVLSNRALNELRVQVSDPGIASTRQSRRLHDHSGPRGTSGKSANIPQAHPGTSLPGCGQLTLERGPHRIKFGVDVNRMTSTATSSRTSPACFSSRPIGPSIQPTPPPIRPRSRGTRATTTSGWCRPGLRPSRRTPGGCRSHLTVNVGVRADRWDVTGTDLQDFNIAPRLGVAWDPFGDGKTAMRGGYGVFYNNVLTNVPSSPAFAPASARSSSNPGYPDPFSRGTAANLPVSTYLAPGRQPLPRATTRRSACSGRSAGCR